MLLKIVSCCALVHSDQISVNRLGNNIYFHLQGQNSVSNLNFLILTETLQRTHGKSLNGKALRKRRGKHQFKLHPTIFKSILCVYAFITTSNLCRIFPDMTGNATFSKINTHWLDLQLLWLSWWCHAFSTGSEKFLCAIFLAICYVLEVLR